MLRFFRQLRQRLLPIAIGTDNKFSKYLLYAVGEILLVVVGILIALQVDAWQQRQDEADQEAYYLSRLQAELNTNRSIAEEMAAFRAFQNNNAHLVTTILYEKTSKDSVNQAFFLAVEHLTWLYTPPFEKDVWEELKSTGNIDLISDRELRTRLSQAYNTMDFYSIFEREWATFNLGYRRLLGDAEVFSFQTRYRLTKGLSPTGVHGVIDPLPDFKTTVTRLREIRGLEGYLTDIILSSETGAKMYSRLAKNIDILLSEIKRTNP